MRSLKVLAALAFAITPSLVFADSIPSLGCAAPFGVLAGAIFNTSGTLTVTGDVGTTTSGDYTNSGTVNASGTNYQDAAPACASTDFASAFSTAEGFTPTVTAPVTTVPPSATFTLGLENTVFSLGDTGLTSDPTFTFNDSADPGGEFIIEMSSLTVSGTPTFDLNGVNPADILWVVDGPVSISGSGTWDGSIVSNGTIDISGNYTYYGGLYTEGDFLHSGGNAVIDELASPVPEPSMVGLLSCVLLALGFAARNFRARA